MKKRFLLLQLLLLLLLLPWQGYSQHPDTSGQLSDYSKADNWLERAAVDSCPVDIFFLYPTTYHGDARLCEVTDPGMRHDAQIIRRMQTSVFDGQANIYMPYYRQANASVILSLPYPEQEQLVRETSATDCLAAFEYYLQRHNNGRPFILAGHSQGSFVLLFIMEYLKDKPELLSRMVASYVIGFAVTKEYLAKNPPLKFARGRDDTGVIVSWNTEAPGLTVVNPIVLSPARTLAINPVSWTTGRRKAAASQSLGSRMYSSGEFLDRPNFADAQIDKARGAVVCSTVDPQIYTIHKELFPLGVLHGVDYSLYYYDLRQNVGDRIAAFLKK